MYALHKVIVIIIRIVRGHRHAFGRLGIAAVVFYRGKIQRRSTRSLPFAVFVLPFVLVLVGIKHHDRVTYLKKAQGCCAGVRFRIERVGERKRFVTVDLDLMFKQDIARAIDERVGNLAVGKLA